jgi:radial spoke head protein 9
MYSCICSLKESSIKHLLEEDRLAATVYLINNDAAVVPRGSWLKTVDGQIIEHTSFRGLDPREASQLKSYVHARLPQNTWNTNLLSRPDYDYAFDFLDTLDEDTPSGINFIKKTFLLEI